MEDSEPDRLWYIKSLQQGFFPGSPTNAKAKTSSTPEEPHLHSDETVDLAECVIMGFPRCLELTAPDGSVRYKTFDVLGSQMEGKVSAIIYDLSK